MPIRDPSTTPLMPSPASSVTSWATGVDSSAVAGAGAARVIAAWQSWAPHAPDALWSNVHLAAAPGGSVPSIQVGGTYLGSLGAAAAELEKLYAAAGSHPSSPFLETTTWLHAMLVEAGWLEPSDRVVFTSGEHMETRGATNTLRLLQVGKDGSAEGLGEL